MVVGYVPIDRLDRFRVLDERAMPDSCDIVSVADGTQNPDGSSLPGAVTTTTVPCRLTHLIGFAELLAGMRLTAAADAILHVPLGTAVTLQDTITFNGITWQIVGSAQDQTYATSIELAVKLVK